MPDEILPGKNNKLLHFLSRTQKQQTMANQMSDEKGDRYLKSYISKAVRT